MQVHRRTLYDDSRGVGEPINETGIDGKGLVIRGQHAVMLESVDDSPAKHRLLGEAMLLRPYHMFVRDSASPKNWVYPTSVSY